MIDLSAAEWRKATQSTAQGNDCVEVADVAIEQMTR